jgi:hypothetical protein
MFCEFLIPKEKSLERTSKPTRRVENKLHEMEAVSLAAEHSRTNIVFPPKFIHDYNEHVRFNAVYHLSFHFSRFENSVELSVRLLHDSSPDVRRGATNFLLATSFGKFPNKFSLLTDVLGDEDPEVRIAAVDLLQKRFDDIPDAKERAMKLLEDHDPEVRSHTLGCLVAGRFSKEEFLSILQRTANDPASRVRGVAGVMIGACLSDITNPENILAMFKDSPYPEIRAYLPWLLDKYKNNPALQRFVLEATQDPDSWVRIMAMFTLFKRCFNYSIDHRPYWDALIEDQDEEVRGWAKFFRSEIQRDHTLNHRHFLFERESK